MFLLDTNIVSNWFRENEAIRVKLELVDPKDVFTASCVFAEAYYGVEKCPRLEQKFALRKFYDKLASSMQILDFNLEAAKIFARIKNSLVSKGSKIEDTDLQIAAIALANDLVLVTNNLKHFSKIPGLKVEDWAAKI